jgi:hypothetical protein
MEPIKAIETVPLSQEGEGGAYLPTITKARQDRIKKVQKMVIDGGEVSEIASYFSVSEKTIYRDIRDAEVINRHAVQNFDQDKFLGESIRFWLQIRWKSMRDSELSREENAKIGHRRNAITAQEKLEKSLQDRGLLNKVPQELKVTGIVMEKAEARAATREYLKTINELSGKNG